MNGNAATELKRTSGKIMTVLSIFVVEKGLIIKLKNDKITTFKMARLQFFILEACVIVNICPHYHHFVGFIFLFSFIIIYFF